jgi:hypothetical protein
VPRPGARDSCTKRSPAHRRLRRGRRQPHRNPPKATHPAARWPPGTGTS